MSGGDGWPALGLGCSRIASLSTRPDAAAIARLLHQAHEGGIRFFDTADIYGQGDSERRLKAIARRPGVEICTKAGLALSRLQPLVRLAKPVLRPALLRLKPAGRGAAALRQKAERADPDPATLQARLEGSLRRLGRERVEVFLLHSPPLGALADGRLYDRLDAIRKAGLAAACGVSCRTLDDAAQVIATGRVQAVELPLDAEWLAEAGPVLDAARATGVRVIAREVLTPARAGRLSLEAALNPLLQDSRLSIALTGTTAARHLAENLALWHRAQERRAEPTARCT